MTTRDWCNFYLGMGFSFIPTRNKRPCIKWAEYQNRQATTGEVERWLKDFPDMGIGLISGEVSNISVVDIDPRNGGEDIERLDKLNSVKVRTPSGGWHYYFSGCLGYSIEIENGAYGLKSGKSYSNAPPTANYEFIRGFSEGLKPLPLWVVLHFREEKKKRIIDYNEEFVKGSRDNSLASYAGYLITKFGTEWYDKYAVEELEKKKNGLERDVRKIAESIRNTHKAREDMRSDEAPKKFAFSSLLSEDLPPATPISEVVGKCQMVFSTEVLEMLDFLNDRSEF